MESSFTYTIANLGVVDALFLMLVLGITVYISLTRQIQYLMFILILSAALVGTTIPILGSIAPVIRWLLIIVLFVLGMSRGKLEVPVSYALFWGYVLIGFVLLFRAVYLDYQLQRAVLMIMVAALMPLVFSKMGFPAFRSSLESIAVAAAIFCLLNTANLPQILSASGRFSGLSKGAASFALNLGGLLVFTLWGVWRTKGWVRVICLLGFLAGTVTLIFSGQRTGTITGVLALLPLAIFMQNKKTIGWSLFLVFFLATVFMIIYAFSNPTRIDFLLSRYSAESGLSGREAIWDMALAAIYQSPIIGHGTGGSEMFFSSSFHNAYLEVWYNTGFLGLMFFVIAQLFFLYAAARMAFASHNDDLRAAGLLALGNILGFVLMSMYESIGAAASSVNVLLYLFLGYMVSLNAQPEQVSGHASMKHFMLPLPVNKTVSETAE